MNLAPPRELKNPFVNAKIVGRNVSSASYRAQACLRGEPGYVMSRGELCEFNHCPHRWLNGYERKDTEATKWGRLVDGLLFHTDRDFAIEPEFYPCKPKKNDPRTKKEWTYRATVCAEWKKEREAEGKEIYSFEYAAKADTAVSVLLLEPLQGDFPTIGQLFDASDKQVHVTAEYHDEETDLTIPVKALIDLVPPIDSDFGCALLDFKTCFTAAAFAWPRAVFDNHYATQAAMYLDMYTAATGEDRNTFLHLLQENYAPWQVGKRFLSAEFIEIGRMKYIAALKRYAGCLKSGVWPSYEGKGRINWNGFEIVEPSPWMLQEQ